MMKYTEKIFQTLSRGGFISANSVSAEVKRWYDAIEDAPQDYYDYFSQIGFYLEGGDGYYYFTRHEEKVDLERKLESAGRWIDYICFLKTYNSSFGPGYLFRAADIVVQIGCDMELKNLAARLFQDKKRHEDIVEKLIQELERQGFIELENVIDGTYKVLTSFRYIEELIDCITISEEAQDETAQ